MSSIPATVQTMMSAEWSVIAPRFDALLTHDLTPATLDTWMTDWTTLANELNETYSRLHVAYTIDTANTSAQEAFFRFVENISPPYRQMTQRLNEKLVASGLTPADFAVSLRDMRGQMSIFREENLPLLTEETKLGSEYNKIIGAQTVMWEGEEQTIRQVEKTYQEQDRARREAAFRTISARQLADREAIDTLWQKFIPLRQQIAENAGLSSYRDYKWLQRNRHDYTPADCFAFHDAIEQVVVPAAQKIYAKRCALLGIDSLRPWDVYVNPYGQHALDPFQTIDEMTAKANAILANVHPIFGDYFKTMRDEQLLDLDNRKGKAPGGYCTSFPIAQRPFIFMNAVGVHDNVQTLLHEAGHAFHVFETAHIPYTQQLDVPFEFAEVASMAMELLAAPYFEAEHGGYYSAQDAARARIAHLERSIRFWPYMAVVDAFQHWVYANPTLAQNPANCDAKWSELSDRFMVGIDYSGLEDIKAIGWHLKQHIHRAPFYYIEYGLAQLGAVQVWRNSLTDPERAITQYRAGLALGSKATLPELFATAGAKLAFDADTLGDAVDLIMTTIATLEGQLAE